MIFLFLEMRYLHKYSQNNNSLFFLLNRSIYLFPQPLFLSVILNSSSTFYIIPSPLILPIPPTSRILPTRPTCLTRPTCPTRPICPTCLTRPSSPTIQNSQFKIPLALFRAHYRLKNTYLYDG